MSKTIKIICRGYRPNTAWMNRLIAYAKAFVKLGHEVVFVFVIPDASRSIPNIVIDGVRCVNLWINDGFLAKRCPYISYFTNLRKIKSYIADGDICMFTDASGFYLRQVRAANKSIKVIFEATEHPEVLSRKFNKKIELAIFYRKLLQVDNVLVITNNLKKHLIDKGIPEHKLSVVNMFVDPERFINVDKTTVEKNVAYCGSVSCAKDGVDILIKAFVKFIKVQPEYKLNIYGAGPQDVINYLMNICNSEGVADSVVFWGMIPNNQMPQKLKNATILALSRPANTQSEFGFPTKLGEYLATSNPVVVTAVGEIPNFIKDGVNGYLALPNDIDSFAQKLISAAENIDKAENVGDRGQLLVQSEFNPYIQVELINHILI